MSKSKLSRLSFRLWGFICMTGCWVGSAWVAPAQADIITGLVGHYTFDDGTDLGKDSSSQANHGSALGGVSQNTADLKVGTGALQLDGSNDYISVPDDTSLEVGQITLAAWIKPTDLSATGDVIHKTRNTATAVDTYRLLINSSSLLVGRITLGSEVTESSGATMTNNAWTHVAMTFDGNVLKFFVNASEVASFNHTGTIGHDPANEGPLLIGARLGNGSPQAFFKGLIDDARVYNRALSSDDVGELLNPIPEPASLGLIGLGMILMLRRRV